MWVILCHLPEKGRREIEEIVEKMKEKEENETEEIKTFLSLPIPAARIAGQAQL